ncbi:uncharacterized protein N7459_001750, partial [Penicillium hispanicum]|uniref:uncharacterized protein n=1 Tax=Penicillium hispanicum TaxID=1080232 RepID=UPI002541607A
MARRSSRPAPASPEAPRAAPKRRASARLSASQAEIKRVKSNSTLSGSQVKSTAKKSKYFEPESSAEPDLPSSDSGEDSGSAYEGEGVEQDSESSEGPDAAVDNDSGSEDMQKARDKGKQGRKAEEEALKGKELWREGVRTGLGPGKEVFIPKPKARDPGKVPYQEETLHPNTKLFLLDLAKHNEREWFKAHDPDYRAAKKDFETFVETLTAKIIDKDSTIPELPVKDLVFRIHRDIRFSKNPLPYKIHFSAAWSRTGKKGPYAAYYVHFQPGSCFVGTSCIVPPPYLLVSLQHLVSSLSVLTHIAWPGLGCGLWNPEADALATLREDIDENASQWKEVLRAPEMRRAFLNGAPDDDDAVVEAFVHHNRESALKTKPKGYEADNQNIKLLRLRSFTLGRPIPDAELMAADAQDRIAALVGVMEPFVTYLNSVVMPD